MIIIINGPCGVGKSTVSWTLLEYFDRAVMLDGDYIGAVHPFEIYDEARVVYLYKTLRHLIKFHITEGEHKNFVINYVFETPESLRQLKIMLAELDSRIYVFRLTCKAEVLEQRVRRAYTDPDELAWHLRRYPELAAILDRAAQGGDLGYPIDTTALNATQVADMMWQRIHEAVALQAYDPTWPERYETERDRIKTALGATAVAIHHIGSTAVPGLCAKPILDIMVEVPDLNDTVSYIPALQSLGYIFVDHIENVDRRFFCKGLPRTHHVHVVKAHSATLIPHLAFRDALRADPVTRDQYAALKTDLAAQHRENRAAYTASKTAFVQAVLKRAREEQA